MIIGAGEVGYHLARRLAGENKQVTLIDKDPAAVRRVNETIDAQAIQGSGSNPERLESAGIKMADMLLAVTDSDEVNLTACLAADILSPNTRKLARIRMSEFVPFHENLQDQPPHISRVINPEIEVVKTIERLMSVPGAIDVGEFAEGQFKFIGVRLTSEAGLNGIKLADIGAVMEGDPPLIAAIVRHETLIVPHGNDRLEKNDLIYFISTNDSYRKTLSLLNKHARTIERVMLIGGGRTGLRLAKTLESKNIAVKIVESNSDRALVLAELLNNSIVLNGDGSDQGLLLEENIEKMDALVALTGDEETNIIVAMLAKRFGVPQNIVKINKFNYFPLMGAIGIDQVVSPRLSAVNSILHHIRQGKVLSAISLQNEAAEVMEAEALETSDIVGHPLKQIKFPKGALLIGILHNGEAIIPCGDSVVHPGDHVVIFAQEEVVPKVEKLLTVKLNYV